jgi:hypothetical protein
MSATAEMTAPVVASDPWEMEVGAGGSGGDYVLCPPGNYPANIIGLVVVGHQDETNDKGESYQSLKLVLAFRLAKKRPDGKPFILAEKYTWSMKNTSNFYALACGLTGKKYQDGEKFNPKSILGICCMVQVANASGKKDPSKTYHNIAGVAQFPEGLPAPMVDSPPLAWAVFDGKPLPDVSWIPHVYGESVAKMVESSAEWKAGKVPTGPPKADGNGATKDSDIPF